MDPTLVGILNGELAADIRIGGRAHERYLQVMDRAFLSDYLGQDIPQQIAGLNTASHSPVPQPWMAGVVTPTGSVVK